MPEGYDGIIKCYNKWSSKEIKLRGHRKYAASELLSFIDSDWDSQRRLHNLLYLFTYLLYLLPALMAFEKTGKGGGNAHSKLRCISLEKTTQQCPQTHAYI